MKTHIFRLESVGPHTVGGPEAGAIDLIYTFLLQEYKQDVYSYLHINQIDEGLNELVMKEPGNKIFINIRYPIHEDFEQKSIEEKNRIRLDVIHTALLRIADYDKKLDVSKLEAIRNKILKNNFSFELECKAYLNNKNKELLAKVLVHPQMDKFDYYVSIEKNGKVKCRLKIYSAATNIFYFPYFFRYGKWKNDNEFILIGTQKEVEIHIIVDKCRIDYKNLTPYENPPTFQMFRMDISKEEKEKAHQDYLHQLPPSHAAIIRQSLGDASN
jgi:hypothetical protein